MREQGPVPDATVARLPTYLQVLRELTAAGRRFVSSEELAAAAGAGPAQVRRDLSHLGSSGTRGVGYEVDDLVRGVGDALGPASCFPVVLVGVGNLGQALAGHYARSHGFRLVALLDDDPAVVGQPVAGLVVRPARDLPQVATEAAIAVVATPAGAAQAVCDVLMSAGVTSILSFAPVALRVPAGVDVRTVDLALELQILGFRRTRRPAAAGQVSA